MEFLQLFSAGNFDLIAVGVAIAANAIIGVGVFAANPKSITNRTFSLFSIAIIGYAILNYLSYRIADPVGTLWLLRGSLFFASWASLFMFQLFLVFPQVEAKLSGFFRMFVIPVSVLVACLTLSPFVFSGVSVLPLDGKSPIGTPAPGLAAFGILSTLLVISALVMLTRKAFSAQGTERKQFQYVAFGALITFSCILVFNVALPLIFQNTSYILFAPLFFFPFLGMTGYAIARYKLFDIKVAAVSILAFLLAVTVIFRIVLSQTVADTIFSISQFVLVVIFSIWLIQATRKEVEQREHIQQLADDLKVANERLKELDKMKSQFLSIASHDLRAPLTVIRNFMSLLLDGTYGKLTEAASEGMRQVFDRATDMAKSVDNYLNVSRIEQGRMKYDFIEIELAPLVEKAVKDFTPNAEKKGLTVSLSSSPDLKGKKAKVDVAKMNEVLNNLLDNSIKYTPKGDITAKLEKVPGGARFTIQDTGVGMSQETIGKLFKLFSTGNESLKVNTSSTGVGLYISKAHVEAHGGRIWAESDGENKGSRFIMELPLLAQ